VELIYVLKPIFEWITGNYTLFENQIDNYIIMAIIGLIAFSIAWNVVGNMYRDGLITSREVGSVFHWIIRLIIFSVLFIVISVVMWIIKLATSIPIWAWGIIVILGVVGIVMRVIRPLKEKS
jgi:hypothetical protein